MLSIIDHQGNANQTTMRYHLTSVKMAIIQKEKNINVGQHMGELELFHTVGAATVEKNMVVAVQLLNHVRLFATPWTAACQASLSFTISQSLLKLMSIESVIPSHHLILCCPLLILPSILPSIRAFSNESALHNMWPKYWSFSFSISPSNIYSGLIPLGLTGLISLQSKGLSRVFSNTTVQKHQFFCTQPSLWSGSYVHT